MREDWGPVAAGLVRRASRAGDEGTSRPAGDAGLVVPLRTWRILEANLQTTRARVVMARVRLLEGASVESEVFGPEDVDRQLAVIDEDLRTVLSLIREGHPAHSG